MSDVDDDVQISEESMDDGEGYEIGRIVYEGDSTTEYEEIEEEDTAAEESSEEEEEEDSVNTKETDDFYDGINYDPDDPEQYWKP